MYMTVCMHTFYLHVPFDIAVNFQFQNTIVLFESYKKNIRNEYFLCIALVLSYKKKLRSSRSLFVKLSGIFYLK